MDFNLWIMLIYIILCIAIAIALFNYGLKFWATHSKYFAVGFYLLAIAALLETMIKIILVYMPDIQNLIIGLKIGIGICVFAGFALIIIYNWRSAKDDLLSKRKQKISLAIIFLGILLIALIVITDYLNWW